MFYGWLYTQALRLYPREFRADFGEEMRAVFTQTIEVHAGTGQALGFFLRELCDLPGSLLEAYATDWLLGRSISMNEESISPSTRWQAFLGMLPFLAFGVSSVIGKEDYTYHLRGHDAEMVVYTLALVGLLIGWIRGFPLWSYGYLGWSLVWAWSNTNIPIYGAKWEYRIWVPFAITVLIAHKD